LINDFRKKPALVVKDLHKIKTDFKDISNPTYRYVNGSTWPLIMSEGLPAVDIAIEFFTKMTPLKPLTLNEGLKSAAQIHVVDIGATGKTGSSSTDDATT
jgi:hypothetical protein